VELVSYKEMKKRSRRWKGNSLMEAETRPRERGLGGIKENDGGREFKYDIFHIRTFVNATMYPHPTQLKTTLKLP
jgi:hypothetical protein